MVLLSNFNICRIPSLGLMVPCECLLLHMFLRVLFLDIFTPLWPWPRKRKFQKLLFFKNPLKILNVYFWGDQPNGPAEAPCEFFGPISGLNFGRWILGGEFLEGEFFRGPLLLAKKNRVKQFDSRIRVQNSGVQNLFRRIRPQIRVPEVQNPLSRNLSLRGDNFYFWEENVALSFKNPLKILNVYFWGDDVYFWEENVALSFKTPLKILNVYFWGDDFYFWEENVVLSFKNPLKILNVYFWGDKVYFWEENVVLSFFFEFFVTGGFWDSVGRGGPVGIFENIYSLFRALLNGGGGPKWGVRFPYKSFEAIFCLVNYFYFLRLSLKTLQKYPSKQA